ncbi:hypothetical protein ScPMuIL_014441 [Solemya velum]
MPLYEGVIYSGDKNIVVLDIGAAYTKCGIAGETGPRCIIPSHIKKDDQIVKLWDFNNEEELYENLKEFLFMIYFRHLLVNPKDRRMVISESLLCPSKFRDTLARVLFRHFEVGSIMFGTSHLLALTAIGVNTGLVMDVGYTETLLIPVYEGIPVIKAIQSLPIASQAIHKKLEDQLKEKATVNTAGGCKPMSSMPDCLNEQILEDIKVRCCFVTSLERAKQIQEVTVYGADSNKLPAAVPSVKFPLDGSQVLNIDGTIREHTCEILFEQDNEENSVPTLVLDALLKCPIDMRLELADNIVVTGGTAMLPGFHHRLQLELYDQLKKPKYQNKLVIKKFQFHKLFSKENYTSWLGGAMYGALETLATRSVSRDVYLTAGKLTDWCCIAEEMETEKEEKVKLKNR